MIKTGLGYQVHGYLYGLITKTIEKIRMGPDFIGRDKRPDIRSVTGQPEERHDPQKAEFRYFLYARKTDDHRRF